MAGVQIEDPDKMKTAKIKPKSLKILLVIAAALLSLECCDAFGQTNGLPRDVETALENADTFTLFSVDPMPYIQPPNTNTFQNYIILGQLDIQSKRTRTELIDSLDKAIISAEETGEGPAKCFNPRHAIRAKAGDETVELLICFECHQIYITSHSRTNQLFMITGDPAVIFNRVLRQAGLPLAPRVYYVGGEVTHPGPELYLGITTVTEAIQAAGGFTPFGSHKVWLKRADGTRIRVDVDKALKDSTRDPAIYPGDLISVWRRVF